MNILLFLSGVFLFTLIVGRFIERLRIPWIFAALLLGTMLSFYNPFSEITSSPTFDFLAMLGMYFLLFVVGLEIDVKKLQKSSGFILKGTVMIIFLEALVGGVIIHFLFDTSWTLSYIVSLSFATVGEAILIPILDEFGIINSKLGQSIIGIGSLDDFIEIFMLIIVAFIAGSSEANYNEVIIILLSLFSIFGMTGLMLYIHNGHSHKFVFTNVQTTFLLTLFIFSLFVGIGELGHAAPIAAILAGISVRNFLPGKMFSAIENEVKSMCYGFFAPIFFLSVGASIDTEFLLAAPMAILIIAVTSSALKIIGSYMTAHKELGEKQSFLLGVGLSIRFSTSIIIVKILLENGLIDEHLYSAIVASSIIFQFIVPVLFAVLLKKWMPEVVQGTPKTVSA